MSVGIVTVKVEHIEFINYDKFCAKFNKVMIKKSVSII